MNEETEEHLIECMVAREKVGYRIDGSIDGENKYELIEIVRYLEKVIQMCETHESERERNDNISCYVVREPDRHLCSNRH